MFKRSHLKMNKAGEEAGGGTGNTPDSPTVPESFQAPEPKAEAKPDETPEPKEDDKGGDQKSTEIQAKLDQAQKEKEVALAEKQALQKKMADIEDGKTKEELAKAEADGDLDAKVAILEKQLAKEKELGDNYQEKFEGMQTKLLMDAKKAEFIKELGADLNNAKDLDRVNWSKVIQNEDGTWNKEGVSQAVEEFRTDYAHCVKSSTKELDQSSAKVNTQTKELSFAERAKQGGIAL